MLSCTDEKTDVQKHLGVPGRDCDNSPSLIQFGSGIAKTLTQGDGFQSLFSNCMIRKVACHV